MSVLRLSLLAVCLGAGSVAAKPLVTSSEETLARICLARQVSPPRIVEACDGALAEAGLTRSQRVELMVARADGFLWSDRDTEAASAYRQAIAEDEMSVEAWNGLGWALWETEGDTAAMEAFDTSMSIDVSVQGLGGQAALGRRLGRISNAEARDMLRAALTIDPEYAWAFREIAWSFMDDNLPDEAMPEFQAALEIDAQDTNARYGMGRAQLSVGDPEAALATFNDLLSDQPDEFATRVYRIIALRRLDRNAQALRDSDRLVEDHPDSASGYIEKALSLIALQRRSEAIAVYEAADEKIGPNNALLYWYADALTIDGRFQEALDVIDRGLLLPKADYSDHLLKSYIALELEDYDLARKSAEDSLGTGVEDPWAHYYIAISMLHSGDITGGMDRFGVAMATGLPEDRVGAFARELISAGKYVEAAQLRLKY